MKHIILTKSFITIISAILFFAMNTVSADEKITIDTDEKAKEIFLGHNWECEWEQPGYKGTSKIVYEEASLKKIIGKSQNSFCPDGWANYKAKIKKGTARGTTSNYPAPCQGTSNDTGTSLTKAADGTLHATSSYSTSYGARGKSTCKGTPK